MLGFVGEQSVPRTYTLDATCRYPQVKYLLIQNITSGIFALKVKG
jgi:hypothetical protein